MGLLVQEINELRQLLSNFDAGTVSSEDLNVKLNIYSQTEKRTRQILQAWVASQKFGNNGLMERLVGKDGFKGGVLEDRTATRGRKRK